MHPRFSSSFLEAYGDFIDHIRGFDYASPAALKAKLAGKTGMQIVDVLAYVPSNIRKTDPSNGNPLIERNETKSTVLDLITEMGDINMITIILNAFAQADQGQYMLLEMNKIIQAGAPLFYKKWTGMIRLAEEFQRLEQRFPDPRSP